MDNQYYKSLHINNNTMQNKIYKSALQYKNRLIKAYLKPVPSYMDMMLLYCLIPNTKVNRPIKIKDSKKRNEWIKKYKEVHDSDFEKIISLI